MTATLAQRTASVLESTSDTSRGLSRVRQILLGDGAVATVDADVFPTLTAFRWKLFRRGKHRYARAVMRGRGGRGGWPHVLMHRYILGLTEKSSAVVDHIDGDGLNNRRSNLRVCTMAGNTRNRGLTSGRGGYKGVSKVTGYDKFTAKIGDDHAYLGSYASAVEAALVYNDEALRRWGEFARPNAIHDERRARDLIARRNELRREADAIDERLKAWP